VLSFFGAQRYPKLRMQNTTPPKITRYFQTKSRSKLDGEIIAMAVEHKTKNVPTHRKTLWDERLRSDPPARI
jgi:hypothetical protein